MSKTLNEVFTVTLTRNIYATPGADVCAQVMVMPAVAVVLGSFSLLSINSVSTITILTLSA